MCASSFYMVLRLVGFSLLPFSFFLHRKSRRENFSTTLRKKEVVKWKHLGEKLKTRHSSSTYCSITSINTALGAGAEQGQLTCCHVPVTLFTNCLTGFQIVLPVDMLGMTQGMFYAYLKSSQVFCIFKSIHNFYDLQQRGNYHKVI